MSGHEIEPVPGLPEPLPPGERILWQGAPLWRRLARDAFHTRKVAVYFGLLAGWRIFTGIADGDLAAEVAVSVAVTLAVGALGVALLALLAFLSAKATMYTITTRRIVMRVGIALPLTINIPFKILGAADAAANADGSGDIALGLTGEDRLGYLALWPHARPWRVRDPQPMLRAIPDVAAVSDLLAGAVEASLMPEGDAPRIGSAQARPAAPGQGGFVPAAA